MSDVLIRVVPEGEFELDGAAIAILVDELDRLETPSATRIAETLRGLPKLYEPTPDDAVALARALDHLRNFGTLPRDPEDGFGAMRLRGKLVGRFETTSYLLDPLMGGPSIATTSWGPPYAVGDRIVDTTGGEWFISEVEPAQSDAGPNPEPSRLFVDPWRPRRDRM
jgi:hypothetical protein